MRIVVARLNHETNTFSPVPTPLSAFDPKWNENAYAFGRVSNTALGAFHAYAQGIGAEIVAPLAATANPSGPVDDQAFDVMCAAIIDGIGEGCDAILLDLHGAMVTQTYDDGEGELLARVRTAAPGIPIGVALDLHANVTRRMIENCDCIVGFKTYPHVDMFATGQHVTQIIDRILKDQLRPMMVWNHPPLLAHTLRMNTNVDGVMADLVEQAKAAESDGRVLAATVFGGFSIADLAETGVSVVTVGIDEREAKAVAREIASEAWSRREEFSYIEEPLSVSIDRARAAAGQADKAGYVLLLDHGDNCMSGGTCDNMDVLQAALAAGLEGVVAGPFADAGAVETLWSAGVGANVRIELGNRVVADGFALPLPPLPLEGKVRALTVGDYVVTGPIYTGQLCQMGRAAVIDTGRAVVLVTERPHEPWDVGVFTSSGIDIANAKVLILKSRMYCRPVFEPHACEVIECASGGVTSSNYDLFSFTKLARPIYPLDSGMVWNS